MLKKVSEYSDDEKMAAARAVQVFAYYLMIGGFLDTETAPAAGSFFVMINDLPEPSPSGPPEDVDGWKYPSFEQVRERAVRLRSIRD